MFRVHSGGAEHPALGPSQQQSAVHHPNEMIAAITSTGLGDRLSIEAVHPHRVIGAFGATVPSDSVET